MALFLLVVTQSLISADVVAAILILPLTRSFSISVVFRHHAHISKMSIHFHSKVGMVSEKCILVRSMNKIFG